MKGFWNGEPVLVRPILIRMIESENDPKCFWGRIFYGKPRQALEIKPIDAEEWPPFVIDNDDGWGLRKVTEGLGSPRHGHRSINDHDEVAEIPETHVQYFDPLKYKDTERKVEKWIEETYPEDHRRLLSLKKTIQKGFGRV